MTFKCSFALIAVTGHVLFFLSLQDVQEFTGGPESLRQACQVTNDSLTGKEEQKQLFSQLMKGTEA